MGTIRMKINGFDFPVRDNATILEASREAYGAKQWDIYIPTLHYLKGVQEVDNSGVCIVAVKGEEGPVNASTTRVREGMEVFTRTPEIMAAQAAVAREILDVHNQDCAHCFRTGNCELQNLVARQMVITDPATNKHNAYPIDHSSIIVRDNNKCIRCGRCIAACEKIQGIGAIRMEGEGLEGRVVPVKGTSLNDTKCVTCGQCINACPVGALRERDDTDRIFEAIADPKKFVVIQAAPSVRASLGEEFEFPVGSETEGKLAAALRELGFDRVFDTILGADLTIMEEAQEFIDRMSSGENLPIMTSCCPGWVKFCEQEYPEFLPNVSSCKSPQQMFGAIVKSYYAQKEGIAKENIVVVSAMPCTAKKFELTRENQAGAGVPDVDYSITGRELADMIRRADIRFQALANDHFDNPMGTGSGAGTIFGATGGVMEAALRTAADVLTGENLDTLEYSEIRGVNGIKEAEYTIADKKVRVAVVNGLANARKLMEQIKTGTASYDFVEVMACPGGCVNGGGQPIQLSDVSMETDIRAKRASALYHLDDSAKIRKSHENPDIKTLYSEYLGKSGSEEAHHLLHTTYQAR